VGEIAGVKDPVSDPGTFRAGANTIRVAAVRRSEPVNLDFVQVAVP
jgi:hypothetical protein